MQGVLRIQPKRILKSIVADLLERPFEDEEILDGLELCGKDKASGPDGFTAEFFLSNWECVKADVLKAVKKNFKNGRVLREVNLIPKEQMTTRWRIFGQFLFAISLIK